MWTQDSQDGRGYMYSAYLLLPVAVATLEARWRHRGASQAAARVRTLCVCVCVCVWVRECVGVQVHADIVQGSAECAGVSSTYTCHVPYVSRQ